MREKFLYTFTQRIDRCPKEYRKRNFSQIKNTQILSECPKEYERRYRFEINEKRKDGRKLDGNINCSKENS